MSGRSAMATALLAAAGACFLFGTATTVADVALRAVAGRNVPAAIELTSLSVGLGALLSMPVCYARRAHVTARLLSELSPRRFLRLLGAAGALASLAFALVLLRIVAGQALEKLGSPETTPDLALPLAPAWIVLALAIAVAAAAAAVGLRAALRIERSEG